MKNVCKMAYDENHEKFDEISRNKVVIGLVGSVNAGKSRTINALTGITYADVKARAGWTRGITLYELRKGIFIADTPGLNDIDESVCEKTLEFVENECDIILFILNVASGVNKHEKNVLETVSAPGREVLVVLNKIDVIEEEELDDVVSQVEEELNVKPIPISAKEGTNISMLDRKICDVLEKKGKDLLYAKISRFKEETVARWIRKAAMTAFGIGALPWPGSDMYPLTMLHVRLAMKIARLYDVRTKKSDIMRLIGLTVNGSLGRRLFRFAMSAIKAAGWIPGGQVMEVVICATAGAIAASITDGCGWACNEYYKSGMKLDMDEFSDLFEKYYEEHKQKHNRAGEDERR